MDIKQLNEKTKDINKWINSHKGITEPNFYEIVSLNMDLLHINAEISSDILKDKDYLETYRELLEMESSRGLYLKGLLKENATLNRFFLKIKDEELRKNIERHNNPGDTRIEKELFAKIFSINYYIYTRKKVNSDYKHDNSLELDTLENLYSIWKDTNKNTMFSEYVTDSIALIETNCKDNTKETGFKK